MLPKDGGAEDEEAESPGTYRKYSVNVISLVAIVLICWQIWGDSRY